MKTVSQLAFALLCLGTAAALVAGCSGKDVPGTAGPDPRAGNKQAAAQPAAPSKNLKAQETCPVMGGKIDRNVFADHKGLRVYFCCPACIDTFKKDPEKYLKILADKGEAPEDAPLK